VVAAATLFTHFHNSNACMRFFWFLKAGHDIKGREREREREDFEQTLLDLNVNRERLNTLLRTLSPSAYVANA